MKIGIYSNGITVEGNSFKKTECKKYITLMRDEQIIDFINVRGYRLVCGVIIPEKCKYYKLVGKKDL